MMNVLFCGYREWAVDVFDSLINHPKINVVGYYKTNEAFLEAIAKNNLPKVDVALFIGWSWILDASITNKFLCLGIHPSDLPDYRGGSPIQNQVINGIENTKISLMTLAEKLDGGQIWMKEDVSLEGDTVAEIFENLSFASKQLLTRFFNHFDKIVPQKQGDGGSYYPRRKPQDSQITVQELEELDVKSLYNKIRCLTDPYPNAYIEGDNGDRLYFEKVRFVPSNSNSED